MVKKFFHIVAGWGKSLGYLGTATAEEKLSALRMNECIKCEQSEMKTAKELTGDELIEVIKLTCKSCGCPCKEKSLVTDEECPIKKW